MTNHILVVAESIDVEDSSGSKANVALIKNLIKAGFKTEIYHYTRKRVDENNKYFHPISENRTTSLFLLSRFERYSRKIYSINKFIENSFGFSLTFFNDIASITRNLKKVDIDKYDLVITLSKGASFRPHYALCKMPESWHKKWLAYIHDPYPIAYYPRPYDWVEPGHNKKRLFFVNLSIKAQYIGFPSLLLANWMEGYFPTIRDKKVIIPHQLYTSKNGDNIPAFFDKLKFNIIHAGYIMGPRNPSGLIEGFKKFLFNNPDAKANAQLLMIGKSSSHKEYLAKANEELREFHFINEQLSFDAVQNIQKNASVNVILEAKSSISPFLPGKFPHSILADRPILLLGPKLSECNRLLGQDYQYWAEIDDIDRISELLNTLYLQWTKRDLKLERPDLLEYLSEANLKKTISKLI